MKRFSKTLLTLITLCALLWVFGIVSVSASPTAPVAPLGYVQVRLIPIGEGSVFGRYFTEAPTVTGQTFSDDRIIPGNRGLVVSADPAPDHVFVGWRINGVNVNPTDPRIASITPVARGSQITINPRIDSWDLNDRTMTIQPIFELIQLVPPTPHPQQVMVTVLNQVGDNPPVLTQVRAYMPGSTAVRVPNPNIHWPAAVVNGDFMGWSIDGGTISSGASTPGEVFIIPGAASNNIVLTARWPAPVITPPRSVTINNNLIGGTWGAGNPQPVFLGQTHFGEGQSGNLYPAGTTVHVNAGADEWYTLHSWTVAPTTLGGSFSGNNTARFFIMPDQDVVITANWTRNSAPIAPRNVVIGNAPTVSPQPSGQSTGGLFQPSTTVPLVAGVRVGFNFTHWTVEPAGIVINAPNDRSTFLTVPSIAGGQITVTAHWTPNNNSVFFNNVGLGTVQPPTHTVSPAGQVSMGTPVTVTAGPNPTGFIFGGWTGAVGTIGANYREFTFIMPSGPVTLTANWLRADAPRNNVIINGLGMPNGGIRSETQEHPELGIVHLNAGTRPGYTFSRWVVTVGAPISFNNQYASETTFVMPNRSVTVVAEWTLSVHSISLLNSPNWPGATNTGGTYGNQVVEGSNHAVGSWVYINHGRRQAHNFTSWTSIPTVQFYPQGNGQYRFRMPNTSVTIWANWAPYNVPIRQVNIANRVYNTTDTVPTGRIDRQTPDALRFPQGHEHVTVDAGTISNYYFVQWVVTPSNALSLARPTDSVQMFRMPNGDVNLTAIWRRVPTGTHSVSINHSPHIRIGEAVIQQGTVPARVHPTPPTHTIGSTVNVYTAARAGYTFTGWTVSPAFVVLGAATTAMPPVAAHSASFVMPSEAVTITANWVSNTIPQLNTPVVTLNGSVISWPAIPNATSYRIYVGGQEVHSVTSANTSFNLSNLVPALGVGTHLVQVRAIGNNTTHVDSNQSVARSYVITPPATPENTRPTGLSIVATANGPILSWNRVQGASHYFVYVNGTRRSGQIQQPTGTENPSFNLNSLNPRLAQGTTHDIQVRAYVPVTGGNNVLSNLSETRQFRDNVPALPSVTNVRIVGNPTLMWDFPTGHEGLVGFRIYVNGQASQHMVGPTTRSISIASLGLQHGTYLIGVRAVGNGIAHTDSYLSTFVQYVSATLPALNTPINLRINGNTLTWNAVPNATGYRIYVNGQPSTAGIIGGLTFNLSTLGLGAGTHLIQVRAIGNDITHTDSAISAFVSYVLPGTGSNPGTGGGSNTQVGGARQYVVAFNAGPGSFPAGEDGIRMGPAGFVINSFTNTPTRAGYTFGGWTVGGTAVNLPLTVNSDMTLNAVWNRIGTTPAGGVGQRPNPQTGPIGFLNVGAVLVLTGIAVFVFVKMANKKKDGAR